MRPSANFYEYLDGGTQSALLCSTALPACAAYEIDKIYNLTRRLCFVLFMRLMPVGTGKLRSCNVARLPFLDKARCAEAGA